jgi:hypothetical protein
VDFFAVSGWENRHNWGLLRVIPNLKTARAFLPHFLARLKLRRESGRIGTTDSLCEFVSTRAAFIAQKTLYGYVKTRMGTRYPSMFEDDVFISSVNIAKMQVFAACLSDLAIFAVSRALADAPCDAAARRQLALACFREGLAQNEDPSVPPEAFDPSAVLAAFERRLAFWDWRDGPRGPDIFTESPAALFRWAPISENLKEFDKEIVLNSIRYAWREVRVELDRQLDGAALAATLTERPREPA